MSLTKAEQQELDYLDSNPATLNSLSPEEQDELNYLDSLDEASQQNTAEPNWTPPPEGLSLAELSQRGINPDKKWAQDLLLSTVATYGVGTAFTMLGGMATKIPVLADVMKYMGTALKAPETFTQGALGGAAVSGTEAVIDDAPIGEIAERTAFGAGLGGAFGKLTDFITTPTKEAQLLLDRGVKLSPGQVQGGVLKHVEDSAALSPTSSLMRNKQRASTESFNLERNADALNPINKKLPANTEVGSPAIKAQDDLISAEYTRINPSKKVVTDPELVDDMSLLNRASKKEVNDLLSIDDSFSRVDKALQHKIDIPTNPNPNATQVIKDSIKRAARRQDPTNEILNADTAFSKARTIEDASANAPIDSVYTAADYLKAVQDKGNTRAFSQGQVFDQSIARAAAKTMNPAAPLVKGIPGAAYANDLLGAVLDPALAVGYGVGKGINKNTINPLIQAFNRNVFEQEITNRQTQQNPLLANSVFNQKKQNEVTEAKFKKQLEMSQ